MKLLHLLPNFEPSSAASQIAAISRDVSSSAEHEWAIHTAAAGPLGPAAEELASAGVTVHAIGLRGSIGPLAIYPLRNIIANLRPDIIHAWRLPAWRAVAVPPRPNPPLVVSQPFRGGRKYPGDRWLMGRATRVVAGCRSEAEAIKSSGLPSSRVETIPLAIPRSTEREPEAQSQPALNSRTIVCLGPVTPGHGLRDAIWAFDILRYVVPDLELLVIGDGPARFDLERFARRISHSCKRIRFIPTLRHPGQWIARAVAVWVPSRVDCGYQAILEAFAAGCPVIATRHPGIAELIGDDRTGLLIPPGDPLALVRATRQVLDDEGLAGRLGAAGRSAARTEHDPMAIARQWADLYARAG